MCEWPVYQDSLPLTDNKKSDQMIHGGSSDSTELQVLTSGSLFAEPLHDAPEYPDRRS